MIGMNIVGGADWLDFLQLAVKASLILGAGLAGMLILKKIHASAAARHLNWLAALLALLALPPLMALLPPLDLPFLPGEATATSRTASVTEDRRSAPTAAFEAKASTANGLAPPPPAIGTAGPPEAGAAPYASGRVAWLVYSAVLACLIARLLIAQLALLLLRRGAWEIEDPHWRSLLLRCSGEIGLRRRVRLLVGPPSAMPMAWGIFRPTILLPAQAMRWTAERRRFVLLHELAHIKRNDPTTQAAAALACAIYWFHPLAWYAAAQLRKEQEHACDDLVLSALDKPGAYAKNLLELARALAPARLVAGLSVTMARSSEIETRLRAILDRVSSRRSASKRGVAALGAAVALLVLPLAAANPVRAAGDADRAQEPALEPAAAEARDLAAVETAEERGGSAILLRRSAPAAPGGTLTIDMETGGELDIRGWDRNEVSLEAELRGRDSAGTRVDLQSSGAGNVTLRSRQGASGGVYSTSHRFVLNVPTRYSVNVESGGGGIRLTHLSGRFTGETGGGTIVLTNLRGEASLNTGGGDISVTDSTLDGSVGTGGGQVRLERVRGSLRTGDGGAPAVEAVAPAAGTVLSINRPGGAIELESADHGARLVTGGGDIELASARVFVEAETGGGNIRLGSVDGTVTATTGAGAVSVGLANGASGGGSKDVVIRSGSGPVTIVLEPGAGAEFEVETGYTASYGKQARILTDLPLGISESSGFEFVNGGTPRRRVFATGRVGDGRYRVKILTVNGDVRIVRGRVGGTAAD